MSTHLKWFYYLPIEKDPWKPLIDVREHPAGTKTQSKAIDYIFANQHLIRVKKKMKNVAMEKVIWEILLSHPLTLL